MPATETKTKAQLAAEVEEPEATKTYYMKEPQYHPDHGKMLPGDTVNLTEKEARRWERLGLIYAEGDKHKGKSLRERIDEAEKAARERVLAEAGLTAQPVMLGGDQVHPDYAEAQKETEERYARSREYLAETANPESRRAGARRVASSREALAAERQAGREANASYPLSVQNEAVESFTAEQPAEKNKE